MIMQDYYLGVRIWGVMLAVSGLKYRLIHYNLYNIIRVPSDDGYYGCESENNGWKPINHVSYHALGSESYRGVHPYSTSVVFKKMADQNKNKSGISNNLSKTCLGVQYWSPVVSNEPGINSPCYQSRNANHVSCLVNIEVGQHIPTHITQHNEPSSTLTRKASHLVPIRKTSLADAVNKPKQQLPKLYTHNMRSINASKFQELKLIADDYDILLLTKTWLNSNKQNIYRLDNFDLHCCHRGNRRMGGGVAAYIRSDLPVTTLCEYTTKDASAYWFLLRGEKQTTSRIWTCVSSSWFEEQSERSHCEPHHLIHGQIHQKT